MVQRSVLLGLGLAAAGLALSGIGVGVQILTSGVESPIAVAAAWVLVVLASGLLVASIAYVWGQVWWLDVRVLPVVEEYDLFFEVRNRSSDDYFTARILEIKRAREDPELPWGCKWEGWRDDRRFIEKGASARLCVGTAHPFGTGLHTEIQLGVFEFQTAEGSLEVRIPIIEGDRWMDSWFEKTFQVRIRLYAEQREQFHDLRFKVGQKHFTRSSVAGPRIEPISGFAE